MADSKKAITAWCLYDVGHSAFAATIMATILPIYFSSVVGADLDTDPEKARLMASAYWAKGNSIAMLLTALSAPLIGALADAAGQRKKYFASFAFIGAFCSSLLFLTQRGDWILALVLFVLARVAFSSSIVVYDGLLPHLAKPEDRDSISVKGYAWGYLGGGVLLALQLLLINRPSLLGLQDSAMASRLAFLSVGMWWGLFTIPLLKNIPESTESELHISLLQRIRTAFLELGHTFRELKRYRQAMKFLAAFWFYNDGIGTIVVMAAIFGTELGLDRSSLIAAILMVQFLGFPFAFAFGWLARRWGAKKSILLALCGYTILCIFAFFLKTERDFWILAFGVSMFQGGSQALSRSMFSNMIPQEKSGEFFGFYDVSSKFAGIVGPLLFAFVATQMGSSRFGILALIVLFIIGGAILSKVDTKKALQELREV